MADDLYGGAIDPLVLGGNAMGMGGGGMFPSPHMGGSPRMGGMGHPFVCTDEQVPPPGRIIGASSFFVCLVQPRSRLTRSFSE